LLCMWGLQGSALDIRTQISEAEIHLLKTEYQAARSIYTQIICSTPPGFFRAHALVNIAFIDVAMAAPAVSVHTNLDAVKLLHIPLFLCLCDYVDAVLMLREGDTAAARMILERVIVKSPDFEYTMLCLEQLANLDYGIYDCQTTLTWATIYLGSAIRSKDKLSTMKALKCLGQIAAAEGETSTAMSLFQVALDGFTFMDVHQWRADCMLRMSKIHLDSGEVLRAKELFEAAQPLFDRCMVQPPAFADEIVLKLVGLHVEKQMLAEIPA